ncbi:hypothetical protein MUK42_25843 [Musa troglodytarum]|uniref:Uncharacterized protein n=1 Tax=Musa troglodytarum TaxID=320322 RepID=A0A9E7E7N5_9LILI|nr:hypothetical protein MUK42_25843 [Musa troglodytarum]
MWSHCRRSSSRRPSSWTKRLRPSLPSPPSKLALSRVEALERELDAAIAAAARARTEKRQAEAAQRAAELRAKDLTRELENTTKVFKLHMEELRSQKEEISKKQSEIKVLEATVLKLSRNDTSAED